MTHLVFLLLGNLILGFIGSGLLLLCTRRPAGRVLRRDVYTTRFPGKGEALEAEPRLFSAKRSGNHD